METKRKGIFQVRRILLGAAGLVLDKLPAHLREADADSDRQSIRLLTSILSPNGMISVEEAAGVRKVLAASLESVRKANVDLGKTCTNQFVEGN